MHVMASQGGGILPAIHLLQFVTARGSFLCIIKQLQVTQGMRGRRNERGNPHRFRLPKCATIASYPGRPLALSTLYPKKLSERKAW